MGIPSSCLNSQSINFQSLPFTQCRRRIQKFLALIDIPIQTTWTFTRTRGGRKTDPWYSALSTSDTTGSSNCFAIVSVEYQSRVCSTEVFWAAGFEDDFPCTLFDDDWDPIQRRTPWTALFFKVFEISQQSRKIIWSCTEKADHHADNHGLEMDYDSCLLQFSYVMKCLNECWTRTEVIVPW